MIKTPDRKWDWGCEWCHARKRWAGDFRLFLKKKAVSWDLNLDEASWFSNLVEARPVGSTRYPARRGNCQHSKNWVSLFPRDENLKVKKVIKVSYLNYRESSVSRLFRDSYALWIFHLFVFGYATPFLRVLDWKRPLWRDWSSNFPSVQHIHHSSSKIP